MARRNRHAFLDLMASSHCAPGDDPRRERSTYSPTSPKEAPPGVTGVITKVPKPRSEHARALELLHRPQNQLPEHTSTRLGSQEKSLIIPCYDTPKPALRRIPATSVE